jgi:hypothetical protein
MADELSPLQAMTSRAIADHDDKKGLRRASEVIADKDSLQTFSARLSARDLVRLRANARTEGISASDLLRTLLEQGLDRLETRRQRQVDPAQAAKIMAEIVKLVDAFDRGEGPEADHPTTAKPATRARRR